ncbi:NACHT domain-containing protein [Microbispora catharanthi]|uniref:NACHT domain-containing protein n=1 Tax=Microbispora catharanthi TaxID=1712871 RepID=A0A5N6BST0_9ACTN|nr:NACHT domain-containing protein [Microbispora catharanthi]KAB8183546.1 hypothetical protein FH610_020880 [Microbispora catharanthi]
MRSKKLWWGAFLGGLFMASLGWIYEALSSTDDTALDTAADQGQLFGVALAILSLLAQPFTTATEPDLNSKKIALAKRVRGSESRIRAALLFNGLAPALVSFGEGEIGSSRHASSREEGDAISQIRNIVSRLFLRQDSRTRGDATPVAGGTISEIVDFYLESHSKRLIITGEKGAGKTVLAIELSIDMATRLIENPNANLPVPVRINAATWSSGLAFEAWLRDQIVLTYGVSYRDAGELIADYAVIPVLDGVDELDPEEVEVDTESQAPLRAAELIADLNSYYSGKMYAPVVLTVRTNRLEQLEREDVSLNRAHIVGIWPLSSDAIIAYLEDRCKDRSRVIHQAWQPVIATLRTHPRSNTAVFLSTPWRLMMAVAAVEDDPRAARELLPLPSETLRDTFLRLEELFVGKFVLASAKSSGVSGRASYKPHKVERWLRSLARHLDWQHQQANTAEPEPGMSGVHILRHLLWPIGGARAPRAMHSLISVSLYIISFLGISAPSMMGVVSRPSATQSWEELSVKDQLIIGLMTAASIVAVTSWFVIKPYRVMWPVPWVPDPVGGAKRLRVKFDEIAQHLASESLLKRLRTGLAIVLFPSIVAMVFQLFKQALVIDGSYVILYFIGMAALMQAMRRWDKREAFMLQRPTFAGDVSLSCGIIILYFGLMAFAYRDFYSALVIGAPMGAAVSVVMAGSWIRYGLGILFSAARGRLPWRFKRFCRWACDAGLLRPSGAAYQFRHHEIQAWLLTDPKSGDSKA